MPRKGWMQVEVPSGWTQLIRGPRPKSVQWPKAVRISSAVPAGVPQPQHVPRGRWRQQEGHVRKTPETSIEAAKKRVRALEAALAVLMECGEHDSPEIKTLQKSLVAAKRAAQELPVGVQLAQCEQFVERAKKRLLQHDEQRATLAKELSEGEARLERLRAQVSNLPVPPQVTPAEEEISKLKEMVASMEEQRDAALQQASVKRQATASTRVTRREEFAPQCDEEMEEWMAGRHVDLQTAMTSGQLLEVARISQLMTSAAQEWHQLIHGSISAVPSVVANSVR